MTNALGIDAVIPIQATQKLTDIFGQSAVLVSVGNYAYEIGDELPDGWIVGPISRKTGLPTAIEPLEGALKGHRIWDASEDHVEKLRKQGHENVRLPSLDEALSYYGFFVEAGRNRVEALINQYHPNARQQAYDFFSACVKAGPDRAEELINLYYHPSARQQARVCYRDFVKAVEPNRIARLSGVIWTANEDGDPQADHLKAYTLNMDTGSFVRRSKGSECAGGRAIRDLGLVYACV